MDIKTASTRSVSLIVLIAGTWACNSGELGRSDARSLIMSHAAVAELSRAVSLRPDARQQAFDLDLWDSQSQLSTDGADLFESVSLYKAVLKQPVEVEIDVTGVAPFERQAQIEFSWRLSKPSPLLAAVGLTQGTGVADAVKYDDGWRVGSLDVRAQPAPEPSLVQDQIASRASAVVAMRQSLLGRIRTALDICNDVSEQGESLSGAVSYYGQQTWPSKVLVSDNGVVVHSESLEVMGFAAESGVAKLPFSQVDTMRVVAEVPQGDRAGALASLYFFQGNSSKRVGFATRGAADEALAKVSAIMTAWRTRCQPAQEEWKRIYREQGYWRGISPEPYTRPSAKSVRQQTSAPGSARVQERIAAAQALLEQRQYSAALDQCEEALREAPGHREAVALREKIRKTMDILGVGK